MRLVVFTPSDVPSTSDMMQPEWQSLMIIARLILQLIDILVLDWISIQIVVLYVCSSNTFSYSQFLGFCNCCIENITLQESASTSILCWDVLQILFYKRPFKESCFLFT